MPISVRCPNPSCGRPLQLAAPVPAARCPHCGQTFRLAVPQAAATPTLPPCAAAPTQTLPPPLPNGAAAAATRTLPPHGAAIQTLPPPLPNRAAAAVTLNLPAGDTSKFPAGPLAAPPVPERIGRFVVRRFLGEGAFGRVYEAHDPQLDRAVALKVAKPELMHSPERVQRFLREAKAAANLRHPHIVPVFDSGADAGHLYIASAFIPGRSLDKHLEELPEGKLLDMRRAVQIVRRLAEALGYAHQRKVVHRDVKPANVMLDEAGEPLLMDFGLASRDEGGEKLTQDGVKGMGTPAYMAPEQGAGDAVAASDQYSLGCTLYELLTGQTPFAGPPELQIFLHQAQEPVRPCKLNRRVPLDLETICLKCLEKEPAKRYADCQELADDLRRWFDGEPVTARRPGTLERLGKWARRRPAVAALSLAVAVVLVAGATVATIFGIRAQTNAATADAKTKEANEKAKEADDNAAKECLALEKVTAEQANVVTEKTKTATSDRLKRFQEYIADMRLIPSLWKDARIDLIRERLKQYEDKADDPRGFEWYYWTRRVVNESEKLWQAPDRIISLDWSFDGSTLFASDLTGQLTAWDRSTGKTKIIREQGSRTMSVIAAPGSDTLAVLKWPKDKERETIDIVKDGKVTQTFRIPNGLYSFRTGALSPDSKHFYTGTMIGRIPSFDVETGRDAMDLVDNPKNSYYAPGQTRKLLRGSHSGEILSLAVSPDGQIVASGGEDGRIGLWSTGGDFLGWLDGHRGVVVSVAFSADGAKLVSRSLPPRGQPADGGRDFAPSAGEVIIWNTAERKKSQQIPLGSPPDYWVHTRDKAAGVMGGNYRAEFIDSDTRVVVGDGNVVKIWDCSTGELKKELKGHAAPIVGLRACAKTGLLATVDERGEVRVWNLAGTSEEEVVLRLNAPGRRMSSLQGGKLAILQDLRDWRKKLTLHTAPDFQPVVPEAAVHDPYVAAVCSPSGRYAATIGPFRAKVMVWETATGKVFRTLEAQRGFDPKKVPSLRCLAFRTDDELYVIGETIMERLNVQTGECVEVAGVPVGANIWFRDLTRAAPGSWMELGKLSGSPDSVMALAFSPDGKTAVFGAAGGDLTVYNTSTWEKVVRMRGHTRGITALAFTADGKRLASCSGRYFFSSIVELSQQPGEIIVWDTLAWQSCLTLTRKDDSEFLGVGFADEGRTLYALANRLKLGTDSQKDQPPGELVRWGPAKPASTPSPPSQR